MYSQRIHPLFASLIIGVFVMGCIQIARYYNEILVTLEYSIPDTQLAQVASTVNLDTDSSLVGRWHAAQTFNGSTDFVLTDQDYIGTGPVTVTAWITPNSWGEVGRGTIVDNDRFFFAVRGSTLNIQAKNQNSRLSSSANGSISLNTKQFVAVTRDGATMNFFVNGSQSGVVNQTNDPAVTGTTNVYIGNRRDGGTAFDGTIEDVRIYNRILTSQEIAALFAGNPIVETGQTTPPDTSSNTQPSSSTSTPSTPPVSSPSSSAPSPINGVYTVAQDGSGQFTTIKACADVVKAGETCLVRSGTYDERVTPANSGTTNNPILFEASGAVKVRGFNVVNRNHITISDFEITSQGMTVDSSAAINLEFSNGIKIYNNNIHDGSRECIRSRNLAPSSFSNNNHIKDNILTKCGSLGTSGAGDAIVVFGDNNLVEENDISHLGGDFTRVTGGKYNVIRNNIFRDNTLEDASPDNAAHIDGMQNWCSESVPTATKYLLIENNQQYNTPSHDTHFVIFQNYAQCDNDNFIVRHNTVRHLGDYILINDEKTNGVRMYNNTFSDTSIAGTRPWNAVGWSDSSTHGKLINNIFNNTTRNGGYLYSLDTTSATGFDIHNNLLYNPGYAGTWLNPIARDLTTLFNQNPLFMSATNLSLQSGSPAIDKGGYLTKVAANDGGSGSTVTVEDAGMFQDGWAGIDADWIAIGSPANKSRIVSIDYGANTIRLNTSLSRVAGDPVYLYRDSSGRQVLYGTAPDVGAHEYENGEVSYTPPAQNPTQTLPSTTTPNQTPSTPGVPTVEIRGTCAVVLNTCRTGTFSDLSDSTNSYRWKCSGSNGGTSETCSIRSSASNSPSVVQQPAITSTAPPKLLTAPRTFGSTHLEIQKLQVFLNTNGFTIAASGPGSKGLETAYFGPATLKALNRFQISKSLTSRTLDITTVNLINTLATATSTPVTTLPTTTGTFTRTLSLGMSGPDVLALQQFLNTKGFTIAVSGPGSKGNETTFFGAGTKAALIRFQEAYRADILTPNGLTKGTGTFGPSTIKKINSLR